LPDGTTLQLSAGEKIDQVLASYGRVVDGKAQLVYVWKYTLDTKNCPQANKNIFGGCNMDKEERYGVSVGEFSIK